MTRPIPSNTALLLSILLAVGCGSGKPAAPASEGAPPPPAPTAAAASAAAAATNSLVAPQHRPQGNVEFKAAFDLKQTPGAGSAQLRHGTVAATAEWPASLYATFPTSDGTAACTAALVGPQTMLTAAHCVPTTGQVTFSYADQPKPYVAACTQHPQYVSNEDPSADYALCKLDRPFATFATFRFDTIDTAAMASRLNATIVLTGFGCVSDIVGAGLPDGKYRIGTNKVDETSASPPNASRGVLYAGSQDNNLFTKDDPALANLCPGDSGGPAYVVTGSSGFSKRVIIGVNSRVFFRDLTRSSYGASLVSSTGTPEFTAWATQWAKDAQAAVCGLAGTPDKCRT